MKTLFAILAASLLITSGFFVPTVIALPDENASDTARQNAQVKIPEHAIEIAPGIYHLGTAIYDGQTVEGIMAFNHNDNHQKGKPGGGGNTDTSSCYSFLAKGAKWKGSPEPWVLNPSNNAGLTEEFLLNNLGADIAKWETDSSSDILGDGTITYTPLVADGAAPDGVNEVYFADIDSLGTIGVTIVWGVFSGPPSQRILVEWDQVYDDVDFGWSATGDPDKMDFENIATHELGHAVGLGHPADTCTDETMYAYADFGETIKRDLAAGDITGINKLY